MLGEGPHSDEVNATPMNLPPVCGITTPVGGETIIGFKSIAGYSDDPDGTVQRVEMKIDNGSWIKVNGTLSWGYQWNSKNVSDGEHTIWARSFDGEDYSGEVGVLITVTNADECEDTECFDGSIWPIVAVAAVLVVVPVVLLAWYFYTHKRKEEPEIEEEPETDEPPSD
jgi:hypothetical protein